MEKIKLPEDTMLKNGMYLFMSKVDNDSIKPVIEWIIKENLREAERKEYLTLIICSPGGSLDSCFALIDTMKGSKVPIHTVGIGCIASCGLLMFITGQKGFRVLTPNTSILSHQYTWGSGGKEHELFGKLKEFELTTKRMIAHYKKCTGLKEKDIRKFLLPETDAWLSAKEAMKLGICDKVKETY